MSGRAWMPGPWNAHAGQDDGCACMVISSAHHPVGKAFAGEWGDTYPAMRLAGPSVAGMYEAYIEQVTYGCIPQEEAAANARLIAAGAGPVRGAGWAAHPR